MTFRSLLRILPDYRICRGAVFSGLPGRVGGNSKAGWCFRRLRAGRDRQLIANRMKDQGT